MVNDAQIGDKPAMVDDAPFVSDQPLPAAHDEGGVVEGVSRAQNTSGEPEAVVQADEAPEDDSDEEAQGKAAADAGEDRANPYDGRTAKGKAWYRGYDSVKVDE